MKESQKQMENLLKEKGETVANSQEFENYRMKNEKEKLKLETEIIQVQM